MFLHNNFSQLLSKEIALLGTAAVMELVQTPFTPVLLIVTQYLFLCRLIFNLEGWVGCGGGSCC